MTNFKVIKNSILNLKINYCRKYSICSNR